MANRKRPIVLATGGTGGHVFPAQALGSELFKQGYQVYVFSDGRGSQFNDSSFSLATIPSSQLHGSLFRKLFGCITLLKGVFVAAYHLMRIRPQALVGFGGYASFPTVIAASLLRIPIIVHQADAYFGRTNRLLASFVTRIATSFPHVENIPLSCQKKVSFTGLPLRSEIQKESYHPSSEEGVFHLFVIGGSQGAKVFGEVMPQAVALLDSKLQKRLHITQQCRVEYLDRTRALYKQTQAHVELAPFWDKMGERYKSAHLVIGRAGASTVGEVALVGRPAIFIPYPYAMDDHQSYNATQACQVNGGWMLPEKEFTSRRMAKYLSELITQPKKLEEAAINIQALAVADAPLRLAHLVKHIMPEEGKNYDSQRA